MNWLRSRLRAWLGIKNIIANSNIADERMDNCAGRIMKLEYDLDAFKSALKAKVAEGRPKQVYTDYESSQQAVLAEYEEKSNGNHI